MFRVLITVSLTIFSSLFNHIFPQKSKSGYAPARGELSEQEALSVIMRGHESMMAVLATRQRSLQVFHSMWMSKNLKVALESTVAAGDLSVILDILNVIVLRPLVLIFYKLTSNIVN